MVMVLCGRDARFLRMVGVLVDVDFCFARAARVLAVPSTTLRSRVYRARERLLRGYPTVQAEEKSMRPKVSYVGEVYGEGEA